MFGSRRRAIQKRNQVVIDEWKVGEFGDIVQEAHERLQAADPDYEIIKIWFLYRSGVSYPELMYFYNPSRHTSYQDWEIMDAIRANLEYQARQKWAEMEESAKKLDLTGLEILDAELFAIIHGSYDEMDCN